MAAVMEQLSTLTARLTAVEAKLEQERRIALNVSPWCDEATGLATCPPKAAVVTPSRIPRNRAIHCYCEASATNPMPPTDFRRQVMYTGGISPSLVQTPGCFKFKSTSLVVPVDYAGPAYTDIDVKTMLFCQMEGGGDVAGMNLL